MENVLEKQERMINAFNQIKAGFNPTFKSPGVRIREKIYEILSEHEWDNDFYLTGDEIFFILSHLEFNQQNSFVQELYSLIESPLGRSQELENTVVDSLSFIFIAIVKQFVPEDRIRHKNTILPQLQEYFAFHGKISF